MNKPIEQLRPVTMILYTGNQKEAWGKGPWVNERDAMSWRDETTGLQCLMMRTSLGHLCGYVGVEPGHYLHGKEAHESIICALDVHGGVSYAAPMPDIPVGLVEEQNLWWIGFDCAHAYDLTPELAKQMRRSGMMTRDVVYRDSEYVVDQATALAKQIFDANLAMTKMLPHNDE